MSKPNELREAVALRIALFHADKTQAHIEDYDEAAAIAATICDTLGITREHASVSEIYHADIGGNWPMLQEISNALIALIELAGRR